DVAPGHAVPHPRTPTVTDHGYRARAFVFAPGDRGRREGTVGAPLLGGDVRREQQREVGHAREHPGDEGVVQGRTTSVPLALVVPEHHLVVGAAQGQVDVTGVS